MKTRKKLLGIGLAIAAILCFFPPHRSIKDPSYKASKYDSEYKMVEVVDYYQLATWVAGIGAITGALVLILGDPRQKIVDASYGTIIDDRPTVLKRLWLSSLHGRQQLRNDLRVMCKELKHAAYLVVTASIIFSLIAFSVYVIARIPNNTNKGSSNAKPHPTNSDNAGFIKSGTEPNAPFTGVLDTEFDITSYDAIVEAQGIAEGTLPPPEQRPALLQLLADSDMSQPMFTQAEADEIVRKAVDSTNVAKEVYIRKALLKYPELKEHEAGFRSLIAKHFRFENIEQAVLQSKAAMRPPIIATPELANAPTPTPNPTFTPTPPTAKVAQPAKKAMPAKAERTPYYYRLKNEEARNRANRLQDFSPPAKTPSYY